MPSRLGSNLDGVTSVDGKLNLRTTNKYPPLLLNAQTSVRKSYSIKRLSECKDGAGPRPVEFGSQGPNAVMVAQQIPRGVVPGEGLQELSGSPFCGWVGGYSEIPRTSAVMAENHEGEQELERDGGYDEEV